MPCYGAQITNLKEPAQNRKCFLIHFSIQIGIKYIKRFLKGRGVVLLIAVPNLTTCPLH